MQVQRKKFGLSWAGLLLISLCIALGYIAGSLYPFHWKPKPAPSEVKPEFNPIVSEKSFEDILKNKKLYVIAPASRLGPEKIQQLESLKQFNIVIPENTFSDAIIFHANSDEKRFELLKEALLMPANPDTILWAFRGGYGAARLMPELIQLAPPQQKKIFIGYSDMTALHLFLSQNWQWQTIHGAGIGELLNPNKDPQNFQKIADMIEKKTGDFKIEHLKPLNSLAEKTTELSGRLTGGNLTIIEDSLGTPWQIQSEGKILLLEDLDVKGYHVDRSLVHLNQAGVFKNVKAIVFGDIIAADENVPLALTRFANEMNIPIFKSDSFGHGKINYPWVYNAESDIVYDKNTQDFTVNMHVNLP